MILRIGSGSFRTSVGIARIWSFCASCGVFTRSITCSSYCPSRCSAQIFFRFANAASDLGVCPATYNRSSTSRPCPFLFAFFDAALALALMLIPHSSVCTRRPSLLRARSHTPHLHPLSPQLALPLRPLPRHQPPTPLSRRNPRSPRRNLPVQCLPLAFQAASLLSLSLLLEHALPPPSRPLRHPRRTRQQGSPPHVHRQQPYPVLRHHKFPHLVRMRHSTRLKHINAPVPLAIQLHIPQENPRVDQ